MRCLSAWLANALALMDLSLILKLGSIRKNSLFAEQAVFTTTFVCLGLFVSNQWLWANNFG